jgi:hypothetical protein
MAVPDSMRPISEPKPRILRVFISYAKEDEKIAVVAARRSGPRPV